MAAAGIYTLGGSFWEFGAPDWEHTKYLMLFGVAEDHDSNPIKIGLGKLKGRGARVVAVNPVRTGYNAIADEWLGITPGTDGLLILSLVHVLMAAGRIDLPYLLRYTNAAWLVDQDRRSPGYGTFLRDEAGRELVWDRARHRAVPWDAEGAKPSLNGAVNIGATHAKPVFQLMTEAYLDPALAPEAVAPACGIPAATIRRIAAELAHVAFEQEVVLDRPWTDMAGRRHATMVGRPVAFHAMRGISAHSNGFQTCRALHLLQLILGSVETPGGFRFKPPYPKPVAAHPRPHAQGDAGLSARRPASRLSARAGGPRPRRGGKAEAHRQGVQLGGPARRPRADAHGDLERGGRRSLRDRGAVPLHGQHGLELLDEHRRGDADADRHRRGRQLPHPQHHRRRRLFLRDGGLRRSGAARHHLSGAPRLHQPARPADLRARPRRRRDPLAGGGTRPGRARLPVGAARPRRPARPARHGAPDGSPSFRDYADYMVNHLRRPGVGPLAGWRGDGEGKGRGDPNPDQLDRYIEAGGFWTDPVPPEAAYYKPFNAAYQDWAVARGFYDAPQPYLFQLYVEPLARFRAAALGIGDRQPPEHLREGLIRAMDPLPSWYPPLSETLVEAGDFPLHALTQRPMAMYHSWGSQNAWLRQIHGVNPLYVPGAVWREHGFAEGDWAELTSPTGRSPCRWR
jgi:sulfite dehydrogenase (quinone) subunit SoeA